VGDSSRGRFATPADFPLHDRTHMYTYAAKVWNLPLVQGPFSAPNAKPFVLRFQLQHRRMGSRTCCTSQRTTEQSAEALTRWKPALLQLTLVTPSLP
jgi:hypothetical protein